VRGWTGEETPCVTGGAVVIEACGTELGAIVGASRCRGLPEGCAMPDHPGVVGMRLFGAGARGGRRPFWAIINNMSNPIIDKAIPHVCHALEACVREVEAIGATGAIGAGDAGVELCDDHGLPAGLTIGGGDACGDPPIAPPLTIQGGIPLPISEVFLQPDLDVVGAC
jgi:hypothetical protein